MGSCISKCKPKKFPIEEVNEELSTNPFQDKLVIAQSPVASPRGISTQDSVSHYCPLVSSSVSCTTNTCTTSSSSSSSSSLSTASSCVSSVLISKDRSFSNQFLQSCVKENPHIIWVGAIKRGTIALPSPPTKCHEVNKLNTPVQHPCPRRAARSSTQKRPRSSNSPTLTHQKTFRNAPNRPISMSPVSNRSTLRSPSPSKRFSHGDQMIRERNSKRYSLKTTSGTNNCRVASFVERENYRHTSPKNSRRYASNLLLNKETCMNQIACKFDGIGVAELGSNQDVESMPIEDIDNPLIALDCFIFL